LAIAPSGRARGIRGGNGGGGGVNGLADNMAAAARRLRACSLK